MPNKSNMYLHPVTSYELENIIDKLLNKTSSGWDGISNKLVKSLKYQITEPLAICINRSFTEGVYPDCLKLAYVSPLFKSGN